jgi:hypothetical protein
MGMLQAIPMAAPALASVASASVLAGIGKAANSSEVCFVLRLHSGIFRSIMRDGAEAARSIKRRLNGECEQF